MLWRAESETCGWEVRLKKLDIFSVSDLMISPVLLQHVFLFRSCCCENSHRILTHGQFC